PAPGRRPGPAPPGRKRAARRRTAAAARGPATGGSCSCSTSVSFLFDSNPADCRRPGRAGAAAPWSLTAEHAAHADVAAGAVAVGGEPALQAPAAVVRGTPQADTQRALVLVGTKARVVRRRTGHVRRLAHGHRGGHAGVDLLLQLIHPPVQMPHIALHLVEPL